MVYITPWFCTPMRSALKILHQLSKTEIPELSRCTVTMRERSRVEETIRAMQQTGAGGLQVISDFDMTLTRFSHNGQRVPTTHNILDNRLLISEDCSKKIKELFNTYYPIEFDPRRTTEEKLPLMVEWWTRVHDLLIQQGIRKDLLARAVKESNVMLRDGYKAFFGHLQEQQVPLLIFSAGIGDVLEEVIQQNHVFHPNVRIISNYMDFDQAIRPSSFAMSFQGVLQAFKGQLIHSFNKSEGAVSQAAGLAELQGRPNVLLLGDSLGDLTMADGAPEHQNRLTIGFLNDRVEDRKESYVDAFDLVLVKDETMDVPNAILRYITSARGSK